MFKSIVEHLKHVELAVKKMPPHAGFAFALSCTERQWPIFVRALNLRPSPMIGQVTFRKSIDSAWQWCTRGDAVPVELIEACRREISEEAGDAISVVVHTISSSIVDLLEMIRRNDGASSHQLAGRNLDLIELLLNEYGLLFDDLTGSNVEHSREVTRIRSLVESEIQHQNKDVRQLSTDGSSSTIEAVRREAFGISLFGDVWFS